MTIGLIPCAGTATRIHGLPKFLLPTPDGYLLGRLIEAMRGIGVQGIIGTTPENSSLLYRYSKTGFVYTVDKFATMSETVLSCKGFATTDNTLTEDVVFGMPDSYIEDENVYPKLTAALESGADVAVALFFARHGQHRKAGMCSIVGNQVFEVVDKPLNKMHFSYLWGALAWKSAFWKHIHPEDPHVGYGLPRAIAAGLDVRAVKMVGGYYDCGTYAEYEELVVHLHGRKEVPEMTGIYA